jgi:hypothetical protein
MIYWCEKNLLLIYVAFFLHFLSLLFSFKIWSIVRQNYDKIGDKVPLHWNFKGNPDNWTKKTHITAYLLFYPSLGFSLFMLALTLVDLFGNHKTIFISQLGYIYYSTFAALLAYWLYYMQKKTIKSLCEKNKFRNTSSHYLKFTKK